MFQIQYYINRLLIMHIIMYKCLRKSYLGVNENNNLQQVLQTRFLNIII